MNMIFQLFIITYILYGNVGIIQGFTFRLCKRCSCDYSYLSVNWIFFKLLRMLFGFRSRFRVDLLHVLFINSAQKVSGIVWTPIRYVTLHLRDPLRAARGINVFMCKQKPYPVRFCAGTKGIRYSMNTYPICDSPLKRSPAGGARDQRFYV